MGSAVGFFFLALLVVSIIIMISQFRAYHHSGKKR